MANYSNLPTVSVVMPVFNGAKTVARALDSVLAQHVLPFEIIAVDDASTDGTGELLSEYVARGLRVLRNDRNGGAAFSRNRGAAAARGAYVAFLDADDQWHPTKLVRQLVGLTSDQSFIEASCTGYRLITTAGQDVTEYSGSPNHIGLHEILGGCTLSPGSTLMVSAACFRAVGPFDVELGRYEDWDWLLRYARSRSLRLEPEVLATVFDDRAAHPSSALPSLLKLGRKHREYIASLSLAHRLKFESRLLLERSAISFRSRRGLEATLCMAASCALYPAHFLRSWPSIWRAIRDIIRPNRTKLLSGAGS